MRRIGALFTLIVATLALSMTATFAENAATIASDKADYAPGETVVLTGVGFAAGETVNITAIGDTNDTTLQAQATADGSGALTASLQLPLTFEAVYAVTATGSTSGAVATTVFDDSVSIVTPASSFYIATGGSTSLEVQVSPAASGVKFQWTVTSGTAPAGTVSGSGCASTNASGIASITYNAPGSVGSNTITAQVRSGSSACGTSNGTGSVTWTANVEAAPTVNNSGVNSAGTQTCTKDVSCTLLLGNFTDPDAGPWTYEVNWDFGADANAYVSMGGVPGNPTTGGCTSTPCVLGSGVHTYTTSSPSVTLKVRVTDAHGLKGIANFTVNVTQPTTGSITVTKTTVNADGTFSLTGPNGAPGAVTTTNGTGSYTFTGVTPGTGLAVTETVPSGWDQTSNTCTNLTVTAGQDTPCTITNTKAVVQEVTTGSITVTKVTVGGNGTFSLTGPSGATGSITTTTGGINAYTFTNVTPGSGLSVSEAAQDGWDLTSNGCTGLTVTAGQDTACTITNTKRGSITVTKVTVGGDGVGTTFSITATGPSNYSNSQSLTTSAPTTFSNVKPGDGYAVSEATQTGWDETSNTCTGLTVTAGADTACTITNTKRGSITVTKVTVGGSGSFTIKATGPGGYDSGNRSINGTTSGGTPVKFDNLVPGAGYAVAETPPTGGWEQTGNTCTGLTVTAGQDTTCTITNTGYGTLVITKNAVGGTSSSQFTFTISGVNGTTTITTSTYVAGQTYTGSASVKVVAGTTYTVTESSDPNYVITASSCDGGATNDPRTSITTATMTVGGTITCGWENTHKATRTVGFWQTHLQFATWVDRQLPIGAGAYLGCGNQDVSFESILQGGFWASVSQTSTGKKRSSADQARMTLLQQMLAASLNVKAFGVSDGGLIAAAKTAYCANDTSANTQTMKSLQGQLDTFNKSGDGMSSATGMYANATPAKKIANIPAWDVLK